MCAETLADCFTRDQRSDRPVLEDPTGRTYDAHWVRTTAWKAGNFLRHTGVRRGVTVGVVGSGPLAVLAFYGTALLEGTTRFHPPVDAEYDTSFRTLVAPCDDLEAYTLPESTQRVGYGVKPSDPSVHHFEAGLWSENPSFPPVEIDPETALLTDGERTISHGRAVEVATNLVDRWDLETGDRVRIDGPLSDPRTAVAGLIAPLLVDAVVVLPGGDSNRSAAGDALVLDPIALEAVDLGN